MERTSGGKNKSSPKQKQVIAAPQDLVLAAATLALAVSKDRSQYEIETLINLFSLTTDNLQAILAQKLINRKSPENLDSDI